MFRKSFIGVAAALSIMCAPPPALAQLTGALVFERNCAVCHDHPSSDSRAPSRDALHQRTPESVLEALTSGAMKLQAERLSAEQKKVVAEYLTGRPIGSTESGAAAAMPNRCSADQPPFDVVGPQWNGWSNEVDNSRFQSAQSAGLAAERVPQLKLKWVFGFPGGTSAYGPPTVVGGRLFVGSDNGYVYALDSKTGCVHWSFQAKSGVRTAVIVTRVTDGAVARNAAYFADVQANVYGVDAESGNLLWTQRADNHPTARVTGSATLYNGRLYVPVASWEEIAGAVPEYSCCTFRGSVVAIDIRNGNQIWKSYSIDETPTAYRKNSVGAVQFRPAGAGIWVTPTIDVRRNALYVGTGDAYTTPAPDTADSILAFDLNTGKRLWKFQAIEHDGWILGCNPEKATERPENCPDRAQQNTKYHDVDFAAAPILRNLTNGRRVLLALNQAGIVYALDPDNGGRLLWKYSAEPGVFNFGAASDDRQLYAPIGIAEGRQENINAGRTISGMEAGGTGALAAIEIATGKRVWQTEAPQVSCDGVARPRDCGSSQGAAPLVIPGVVFAGARDGMLRAYATADGRIIWEFNTRREFETVNRVAARGGTMDGPGPVMVGGMLFVESGYSLLGSGIPGNVLLAFGID